MKQEVKVRVRESKVNRRVKVEYKIAPIRLTCILLHGKGFFWWIVVFCFFFFFLRPIVFPFLSSAAFADVKRETIAETKAGPQRR